MKSVSFIFIFEISKLYHGIGAQVNVDRFTGTYAWQVRTSASRLRRNIMLRRKFLVTVEKTKNQHMRKITNPLFTSLMQ